MPQRTEFLTVPEVMAYLRLGRTTVYAQARLYLATGGAEGIPCRRFGRSLRFPADELAHFAGQSQPRADAPPPTQPDPTPARATRLSKRSAKRTRPSSAPQSQSRRTASAPSDDNVVQAALPFTD
jgi:hypothetical protein